MVLCVLVQVSLEQSYVQSIIDQLTTDVAVIAGQEENTTGTLNAIAPEFFPPEPVAPQEEAKKEETFF